MAYTILFVVPFAGIVQGKSRNNRATSLAHSLMQPKACELVEKFDSGGFEEIDNLKNERHSVRLGNRLDNNGDQVRLAGL